MFRKKTKSLILTATLIISAFFNSVVLAVELSSVELSIDDIRDPFYIGLGLGVAFLKPETNSVAVTLSQDSDVAYKLFGGYQFNDNWAAEFFWADMGQAEVSSGSTLVGIVEYQSFGVGGLYQYQVTENWGVFATAGIGRLRNSFQLISAERVEDSFIYAGAGVMWNMTKTWDLRAEYDYYDSDAQMLSLNIVKRFGSATSKRIARLENKVQAQQVVITSASIAPAPVEKQKTCDDYAITLNDVIFAKRSVELTQQSKKALDEVLLRMLELPEGIKFEVRAHTDDTGAELYNYTLSLARARVVRDYFAEHGIALSRIDAQGYGEWRPKKSNETQSGRYVNRRAELILLGVEKYVENTETCTALATPSESVPR